MRIAYFLSETLTNLRRNLLMTIAAISTVAISLLLLGGVLILGLAISKMTADLEEKVEVRIFLRNDATQTDISSLETELSEMDEVQSIDFVSKAEAFAEFKETYPDLTQDFLRDRLPASFLVRLTDANFVQLVAAQVTGAPGVDDVRFGKGFVEDLLTVNSLLRAIALVMAIILMVAAAALIANTIRLAIYARREEIGIMKLVGATNWFIRIPFMLEGLFAALVGVILSVGIVVLIALLLSRVGSEVPLLENVLTFDAWELVGVTRWLVLLGTVVGLVGSGLALRRFLEV